MFDRVLDMCLGRKIRLKYILKYENSHGSSAVASITSLYISFHFISLQVIYFVHFNFLTNNNWTMRPISKDNLCLSMNVSTFPK